MWDGVAGRARSMQRRPRMGDEDVAARIQAAVNDVDADPVRRRSTASVFLWNGSRNSGNWLPPARSADCPDSCLCTGPSGCCARCRRVHAVVGQGAPSRRRASATAPRRATRRINSCCVLIVGEVLMWSPARRWPPRNAVSLMTSCWPSTASPGRCRIAWIGRPSRAGAIESSTGPSSPRTQRPLRHQRYGCRTRSTSPRHRAGSKES
jgi:hypothetical protein